MKAERVCSLFDVVHAWSGRGWVGSYIFDCIAQEKRREATREKSGGAVVCFVSWPTWPASSEGIARQTARQTSRHARHKHSIKNADLGVSWFQAHPYPFSLQVRMAALSIIYLRQCYLPSNTTFRGRGSASTATGRQTVESTADKRQVAAPRRTRPRRTHKHTVLQFPPFHSFRNSDRAS